MLDREKQSVQKTRALTLSLFEKFGIQTAEDIREGGGALVRQALQEMLEAEMCEHLGYNKSERTKTANSRNGTKSKTVYSKYGAIKLSIPQDRESSFTPLVVGKRKRDVTHIDHKVLSLYASSLTENAFVERLREVYEYYIDETVATRFAKRLLPLIAQWNMRPLASAYPILFIDTAPIDVSENGKQYRKILHVIMGVNEHGNREVLLVHVGEEESAQQWLMLFRMLKTRGVKDVHVLCAAHVEDVKMALVVAYPGAKCQKCVIDE